MPSETVFPNIQGVVESDDTNITEMESYCVNCGENGMTRMLLTEIPFFRQVVVISFECTHCNFRNNELQPAQQIAERGVRFELKVNQPKDLQRTIVKTEWAQIQIPEIEFEVSKQNGLVTTVEGIIDRAITGLQYSHDNSDADEQSKLSLKNYIDRMSKLKNGDENFTLVVCDISGNSFIENLCYPESDPQLTITHFIRTIDDDKILGMYLNEEPDNKDNLRDEVLQFPTNCSDCNAPCLTNMKVSNIPHFKEIIIMATNCEICGHRTNEIKSGAGIEDKGVRITVKVNNDDDLKKEVVRSDTCNLSIPELKLDLNSSGSGRYTTIQGLGLNIIDDLQKTNPFIDGDSTRVEIREKIEHLNSRLENLIGTTIILDDPCGNSFVENAENVEYYERTFEQNEELGLNDIKTENYQNLQKESILEEKEEEDEEEK